MACYWSGTFDDFQRISIDELVGILTNKSPDNVDQLQVQAWRTESEVLHHNLHLGNRDRIIFEYTIPRMGRRVDVVILHSKIVFLLEFKCGDHEYRKSTYDQVYDYALDLKCFQTASEFLTIVPIMISTEAPNVENLIILHDDGVVEPLRCNRNNIMETINQAVNELPPQDVFSYDQWENSRYFPTPTIIEAAVGLYNNMSVEEIARNDAGAQNIHQTMETIDEVIRSSRENHSKSICFVTGVPGAGKTLVGLNTAVKYSNAANGDRAVFVSGNQPLVTVLQEALARDRVHQSKENGEPVSKADALRQTSSFIQIVHRYRDSFVGNNDIPPENIAIFDEAQRAWNEDKMSNFMRTKKNIPDFEYSEPEFLISTMDRRNDWAVIICLIGGGQEINTGEGGLAAWFDALRGEFTNWKIYISSHLQDSEYLSIDGDYDEANVVDRERLCRDAWTNMVNGIAINEKEGLHLHTSMRSFRTEDLSDFVKAVLDVDMERARILYGRLKDKYPILLTRNLQEAKNWVRTHCRGTRRYGLVASSSALRLKPDGICVKNKGSVSIKNWFLDGKEDTRSSYYLEDVATEFDIQGLELDYALVAWDADFRFRGGRWQYKKFKYTRWENISARESQLYLKNAYRVLLTRAREGMAIYIPEGDNNDFSRRKEYYNETYNYLLSIMSDEHED